MQTTMRDYTGKYTPEKDANLIVALANIRHDSYAILEPSAGDGAIVSAIKRRQCELFAGNGFSLTDSTYTIHAAEINPKCVMPLLEAGADMVFIGDFTWMPLKPVYDRIIANPPFGNGVSIDQHISKMCSLLKGGGKLLSVVPQAYDCPIEHTSYELRNWATNKDGTVTPIKLISIEKDY